MAAQRGNAEYRNCRYDRAARRGEDQAVNGLNSVSLP